MMLQRSFLLTVRLIIFSFTIATCNAATLYVDLNSPSPTPPYNSWGTAATNIQEAIDATTDDDTVLVTNGNFSISSSITVSNAITVSSMGGAEVTTITGSNSFNGLEISGNSACIIEGLTITQCKAGVQCSDTTPYIRNCIITSNNTGCVKGRFEGCLIMNNESNSNAVGGAIDSLLVNCTLAKNRGAALGGALNCNVDNCIVWGNTARSKEQMNLYKCTVSHSCSSSGLYGVGDGVSGCITADPQLTERYRLHPHSPCRGSGNNDLIRADTDLANQQRIVFNQVDMGAYEWQCKLSVYNGPIIGGNSIIVTNGAPVSTNITGVSVGGNAAIIDNQGANWVEITLGPAPVPNDQTLYDIELFFDDGSTQIFHTAYHYNNEFFVDINKPDDSGSGLSWAEAKQTIQAAIDTASPGDSVTVGNGTYPIDQSEDMITISNAVTVRSAYGPKLTIIDGQGRNKCIAVNTSGKVTISGLSLINGRDNHSAGGIHCSSGALDILNCIFQDNYAKHGALYGGKKVMDCQFINNGSYDIGGAATQSTLERCMLYHNWSGTGGAVTDCTLNSCFLYNNRAHEGVGGGAINSTLNSCTVINNKALSSGGGVHNCTVNNSIVYYNTAAIESNCSSSLLQHSCTTPLHSGAGNFAENPGLSGLDNPHLLAGSPCIGTGNTNLVTHSSDYDDESRVNDGLVDVGCDQRFEQALNDELILTCSCPYTNVTTDYTVKLSLSGSGRPVDALWNFGNGTEESGNGIIEHRFENAGDYDVVVNVTNLLYDYTGTVTVHVVSSNSALWYVSKEGNDANDGTSWSNAMTTIQRAVDAADVAGALVLVSNGVYQTGGAVTPNYTLTNRVCITSPMTLRSVEGPELTIIKGAPKTDSEVTNSVRGVYLDAGSIVDGFCITEGCSSYGSYGKDISGGGVYINNGDGMLLNCILRNNSAVYGGGAYNGTLINCTVADNDARYGGGVAFCAVQNSILWDNTAIDSYPDSYRSASYNTCASSDVAAGVNGCITTDPQFADPGANDFRLGQYSPCINAGSNTYAPKGKDIVGNPRISADIVDMGAYESTWAYPIPAEWLTKYNLGSRIPPHGNPDNDPATTYEEYVADTSPIDGDDFFHITAFGDDTISFNSSSNRFYGVSSSTNLTSWSDQPARRGVGGPDSMTISNELPAIQLRMKVKLQE